MVKMTPEVSTRKCVSLLLECCPFRTKQLTVPIKQVFTLALERKNLSYFKWATHNVSKTCTLSQIYITEMLCCGGNLQFINMEKSIKLRHAVSVGPLEPSQYIGQMLAKLTTLSSIKYAAYFNLVHAVVGVVLKH